MTVGGSKAAQPPLREHGRDDQSAECAAIDFPVFVRLFFIIILGLLTRLRRLAYQVATGLAVAYTRSKGSIDVVGALSAILGESTLTHPRSVGLEDVYPCCSTPEVCAFCRD